MSQFRSRHSTDQQPASASIQAADDRCSSPGRPDHARVWQRRGLGSRGAGVLLAVAVLLIGTGVYLYVALNAAPAVPGTAREIVAPEVVEAPDLASSSGLGGGPAKLQFFDRNDPTRVRTQLEFDELDPLPRGRYALTRPRAWVFPSGGSAVRVDAAAGDVRGTMVGAQREIESGIFTGGVLVRLYDLPDDGSAIDPDTATPKAQLFTDRLEFDAVKGELFTSDRFYASTAELEIEADGLRVLFDELEERIALLETRERGFIRYAMANSQTTDNTNQQPANTGEHNDNAAPATSTTSPSAAASPTTPTSPSGITAYTRGDDVMPPSIDVQPGAKVNLYHTRFIGEVRVIQGDLRRLESDTLDLWTRLVDGSFREEMLSQSPAAATNRTRKPITAEQGVTAVSMSPQQAIITMLFSSTTTRTSYLTTDTRPAILSPAATDEDVVLTWSGPMKVITIESAEQLNEDDLFARFDCLGVDNNGTDRVKVIDRTFEGFGLSPSIAYAATRRVLFLEGQNEADVLLIAGRDPSSPTPTSEDIGELAVRLDEPSDDEAFRVVAQSVKAELLSGRITMPGAGTARARNAGRIQWTESGFVDLLAVDGNITGVLEEAYFVGDVVASDATASLRGDSMLATFELLMRRRADGSASPSSAMDNLIVVGRATGADAEGNTISADRFDVEFDTTHAGSLTARENGTHTGMGDPEPSRLLAEGNFVGQYRGQRLIAETLNAGLMRDERGRLTADDVTAEGDVVFEGRDGVRATAWKLLADAPVQYVSLIAKPGDEKQAEIARGPSVIRGRDLQLSGLDRTLHCFGPGRFDHEIPAEDNLASTNTVDVLNLSEPGFAYATWTKSMLFDDRAGIIECVGDAEAVIEPSPLSRDRVRAHKVILTLTPGDSESSTFDLAAQPQSSDNSTTASQDDNMNGDNNPNTPDAFAGREVLKAHAVGASMEYIDGSDAWVESSRYVLDPENPEGRRRDRLIYLEGPEILADQQAQTLSVPHPGRALIDDRRESSSSSAGAFTGSRGVAGSSAPAILGSDGFSGSTYFTWQDRMLLERAAGRARMGGGVRLVHRPLGETSARELVCTTLTATLASTASNTDASLDDDQPTLETVDASGAVYVRLTDPDRQLLADRLFYNAREDLLEATASDDNRVTFIDERGIPVTAAKLRWNLLEDRVDVLRPTPIVSPR